jgi:hypothetical protein
MQEVRMPAVEEIGAAANCAGPGNPFDLSDSAAYAEWRALKLAALSSAVDAPFLRLADPARLSGEERAALLFSCATINMALYEAPALGGDEQKTRAALAAMIRSLGLTSFEEHRSASEDGVVAIEVADTGGRAGFIPYTNRAINWHTDGYYTYRAPDRMIRSMVLHCVRNAQKGGENAFMDPDLAYIRLRDANPGFITALMQDDAMTIPAFDDEQGKSHPAVTGPVFVVSEGELAMRFTIRKRNIEWRDDPLISDALAYLGEVLADDPLIIRRKLEPDQGIVCNNVLHDRKAFENEPGRAAGRLMYRVRSYDRIGAGLGSSNQGEA